MATYRPLLGPFVQVLPPSQQPAPPKPKPAPKAAPAPTRPLSASSNYLTLNSFLAQMDTPAPYKVAFIAEAPRSATCPVADAVNAAADRASAAAKRAGFSDFCVTVSRQYCTKAGWFSHYEISAQRETLRWTDAHPRGIGDSLAEAEAAFLASLAEFAESDYDADPSRYIDAQIEAFQALELAA